MNFRTGASISLKYLLIMLIGVFLSILYVKKTKAISSPFTGSCAGIITISRQFWIGHPNASKAVDGLLLINFDEKKMYIKTTNANLDAQYPNTQPTYSNEVLTASDLQIAPEGNIPGAYRAITSEPTDTGMTLIPVNSGNSILIQGINSKEIGVCQKI